MKIAISTCPNDTFAFHGLLTGEIDTGELELDFELLDIQQLNDGLFSDRFDVAKASFHAALLVSDQMLVLPSGSALGFGVGPLLLAAKADTAPSSLPGSRTLCPGQHTTATMLFRMFHGREPQVEHVVFSDIMPQLKSGDADFGVCIHEGRFTWQEQGLACVEDLGTRWESETHCPLPLGGILGRRSLGQKRLETVQSLIAESLQFSLDNPAAALPTMRKYAQEFDDDVLMKHVELYVNDWTKDLGEVGASALGELSRRAKSVGLVDDAATPLQIFSC